MTAIANTRTSGYLLVVSAACLWGSMSVLSKSLFNTGLEPLAVSSVRAGVAFLATLLLTLVWRPRQLRIECRDIVFFLFFGFFGVAVFYGLMFWSISLTSVATAVILLYTAPLYVTLYGWLRLGEKMHTLKLLSLLLSFCGGFWAIGAYDPANLKLHPVGIAAGCGSALAYAAFNIMGEIGTKKYPPLTVAVYSLGFGALFLALLRPPWRLFWQEYGLAVELQLLVLGVAMTFLPYVLYTAALDRLEASTASIAAMLEPVVGILLAALFLGEYVAKEQIMGAICVLGGLILLRFQA